MTDLELENLEAYFQNRKEVVFAFLWVLRLAELPLDCLMWI